MNREVWRAAVHGFTKNCTWLGDWTELNRTAYLGFPICTVTFSLQYKYNLPAKAGDLRDTDSILGSVSSSGEGHGNPFHIFAWRIPWTEESGWLQLIELHTVGHDWNDLACTHIHV